ncbi:uncharacterized protein LOC143349970 [Colletes latitarsis]|uniref:uncharacterized protein LOC143349970 n=1 Tax=Colletes latitarsis TaxID=2605962 RepID=UPI004035E5F3
MNYNKICNSKEKLIAIAVKRNKLFELNGEVARLENKKTSTYTSSMGISNIEKWHRYILCHTNFRDLKYLCEAQLLNGTPVKLENEIIKCEVCPENKMTNLKFKNKRTRANDLLQIVHTDVHGPITQTGHNGILGN